MTRSNGWLKTKTKRIRYRIVGWLNKQIWLKINTSANPSSKFLWKWNFEYTRMLSPFGRHQNEKQDSLMNESHSSSCVSSCSCKSFVFHRNGTATGFIKIYELNHHRKYKTLVGAGGARGRMERRGSRRRERKKMVLARENEGEG